jgi:hypothetical protein
MKICEKCNSEYDTIYGSGRFCSRACANSRVWSEGDKKNKSESARKSIRVQEALKKASEKSPMNKVRLERITNVCVVCNKDIQTNIKRNQTYHRECWYSVAGGYRQGSGRSKGSYYEDQWFDSDFEIEVAKFLNDSGIKWIRNTRRFYYSWNDKKTYYIPDFYLEDYQLFLETKGYWWSDKKQRTEYAVVTNNIQWICVMQKEWETSRNVILEKIKSYEKTN